MLFQPLRIFVPLSVFVGALGSAKAVFDIWAAAGRTAAALDLSLIYQRGVVSTSAILLLLVGFQLLTVGMVADGVLRRIAQQRPRLVPSRAISALTREMTPEAGGD